MALNLSIEAVEFWLL